MKKFYTCEICERVFDYKSLLIQHLRTQCKKNNASFAEFQCKECGRIFVNSENLQKHINNDTLKCYTIRKEVTTTLKTFKDEILSLVESKLDKLPQTNLKQIENNSGNLSSEKIKPTTDSLFGLADNVIINPSNNVEFFQPSFFGSLLECMEMDMKLNPIENFLIDTKNIETNLNETFLSPKLECITGNIANSLYKDYQNYSNDGIIDIASLFGDHHYNCTMINPIINNNTINPTVNNTTLNPNDKNSKDKKGKFVLPGHEYIGHITKEMILQIFQQKFSTVCVDLMNLIYFNKDVPQNSGWSIAYPKNEMAAVVFNHESGEFERKSTEDIIEDRFANMIELLFPLVRSIQDDVVLYPTLSDMQKGNLVRFLSHLGYRIATDSPFIYKIIHKLCYEQRKIPMKLWGEYGYKGNHLSLKFK